MEKNATRARNNVAASHKSECETLQTDGTIIDRGMGTVDGKEWKVLSVPFKKGVDMLDCISYR